MKYLVSPSEEFNHSVKPIDAESSDSAALGYAENDDVPEECYYEGTKLYVVKLENVPEYTVRRHDSPVFDAMESGRK